VTSTTDEATEVSSSDAIHRLKWVARTAPIPTMMATSRRASENSSALYMIKAKGASSTAEMSILPAAMARKSASDHLMRMAEKDTATTATPTPA